MSEAFHPDALARPSRLAGLRSAGLFVAFLAAVNIGAYFAAPSLFELDRARGPYTAANNFELTRVYSRAIEGYVAIIEGFPDSRYAALSEIGVANSLLGMGRRGDAIDRFNVLLEDLRDEEDYPEYRLTILGRLSSAYQDAGDAEGFRAVYAMLLEEHPEADVTIRALRYAEELDAAEAAAAEAAESGVASGVTVGFPEAIAVGDEVELSIAIAPEVIDPGTFGLAVNLAFWDGFRLLDATPAPSSSSDFWGKRFLQYSMPAEGSFEVVLRLRAQTEGSYVFDLDLERSFDIREIGQIYTLEVTGQ